MKKAVFGMLAVLVLFLGVAAPTFADENEVAALKSQIDQLNKKLSDLESRFKNMDDQVREVSKPSIDHPGHFGPIAPPEGGFLRTPSDIKLSGYVDGQWSQALGTRTSNASGNVGRFFDRNQNTFTVNSAELDLEKEAEVGGAGFRVDLQFGEDPAVVNADGDGNRVDLQQAYVQYVAPLHAFEGSSVLPDKIDIKAGRYVTLAGAEVIEGPDNWNISRSFMFGYSIPFTHTGLRTNFGLFDDKLDVYLGINNGWDAPIDTNSYKTFESAVGYDLSDSVSVFHALYWGPETANTNSHRRFLLTNVVSWDVNDKLSLMGDFDVGKQNRFDRATNGDVETAHWYGFAGYARYQFTDKLAFAYRMEIFHDGEESRSALDRTLWGNTWTAEYKLSGNMLTRFEYRLDKAGNESVLSGVRSSQSTLGAQVVYVI